MLASVRRSGLVEAEHQGAVAVVDVDDRLILSHGDVDRVFWLRSAAKPFQATVSQESGAALADEQLALACASHHGQPIQVAIVSAMLGEAGLEEGDLRCPPAWPRAASARDRVVRSGARGPRPLWHNCSGKHAAMLRAVEAQGWPRDSYLEASHPLQEAISACVESAVGAAVTPLGVDGCGVPVHRASVIGLARAYARLGGDGRFRSVWTVMHRFPSLIEDSSSAAAQITRWLDAAAKGGAEGCMGIALRSGIGLAAKSWDGAQRPLAPALLGAARRLGLIPKLIEPFLEELRRPAVLGGGRRVGWIEAAF